MWTQDYEDAARAEGWQIYTWHARCRMIASATPTAAADSEAAAHVVAKAYEGSALHLTALSMLPHAERCRIDPRYAQRQQPHPTETDAEQESDQ